MVAAGLTVLRRRSFVAFLKASVVAPLARLRGA
jgi:hypothetical protein